MEYIYVNENFLDGEMCINLIEFFKNNPNNHFQGNFGANHNIDLSLKNSKELTLPVYLQDLIIDKLKPYLKEYMEIFNHFPKDICFENFRLKEYLNDGKHFYKKHIDSSSFIKSNRLLAVIIYLNDVYKGGETIIYNSNEEIKINPQIGKLVFFPSNFCYPHEGTEPISNNKYILVSFICFKPPQIKPPLSKSENVKPEPNNKPKNNITVSKLK